MKYIPTIKALWALWFQPRICLRFSFRKPISTHFTKLCKRHIKFTPAKFGRNPANSIGGGVL